MADHQTVTTTFSWFNFGFGNALELLLGLTTELVVTENTLFVAHHNPIEKWFVVM